jgi:peptidyl-prolyl cis-trans isomerase A (cyclophilin A)
MAGRLLLFLISLLLGAAAFAQEAGVPPAADGDAQASAVRRATVRVVLETSAGPIALELESERAPITSANFLRYVDQKRLDGTTFYRAMKIGSGFGLVQGGVKGDPRRSLPPIAHEPTTKTGLSHVDGAISMARYAPGSAAGDFFIMVGASPAMDANPAQAGDNLGFAVFGRVVDGMDVVRRILASPTSPTEGEGVMRGQMLSPAVRIISARRDRGAVKGAE